MLNSSIPNFEKVLLLGKVPKKEVVDDIVYTRESFLKLKVKYEDGYLFLSTIQESPNGLVTECCSVADFNKFTISPDWPTQILELISKHVNIHPLANKDLVPLYDADFYVLLEYLYSK